MGVHEMLTLLNKISKLYTTIILLGGGHLWKPTYINSKKYIIKSELGILLTLGLAQDDFVLIIYFRFKDFVVGVFLVVVSIIFLVVGWAHVAKHWDRVKKRLALPK